MTESWACKVVEFYGPFTGPAWPHPTDRRSQCTTSHKGHRLCTDIPSATGTYGSPSPKEPRTTRRSNLTLAKTEFDNLMPTSACGSHASLGIPIRSVMWGCTSSVRTVSAHTSYMYQAKPEYCHLTCTGHVRAHQDCLGAFFGHKLKGSLNFPLQLYCILMNPKTLQK